MTVATADEPSPLLRKLRELADVDESIGSANAERDASDMRHLADLLSERRYADAYAFCRGLDEWMRQAVPVELRKVLYSGRSHETHSMTVDEAWRRIRSEEIAERLEVIEAEAKALRAELDTLQPKEVT